MLKTVVEALMGIVMLLFSFFTTAILPLAFYVTPSTMQILKHNNATILKKQDERERQLANYEYNFPLSSKRAKLLKMSEEKLVEGLQARTLSATDVLEAFIAKAVQVTRRYNCVTEFVNEALDWAKELDQMDEVKGPLHGIPVSIKENCGIKGMDATFGYSQNLYKPAEEDAVIVKALKELGAIPFCKTNIPQSLFTYACGNPIYGETVNPLNSKLSPGGSSGGESCLIAGGGSILGVGTDVGGSVRIPSHFCGTVALKPSKTRMSLQGFKSVGSPMVPVAGTCGFITRNTKTLVLAYKSLYESGKLHLLDPGAVPIPWNEMMKALKISKFMSQYFDQRVFGYFTSLPYFPLIGDTEEVVSNAKRTLEAAGHEVVRFKMPDMDKIMATTFDLTCADLGTFFMRFWRGEPVSDAALAIYWLSRLPLWLRKRLAFICDFKWGHFTFPVVHSPAMAKLLRVGDKSWKSSDLWDRIVERKILMDEIINQWKSKQIDVLLSPVFPFPALPYAIPGKLLQAVAYTIPWNLFDFPAGVVRFGIESGKLIDSYDNRGDFILRMAQEGARESVGMPIAVQIIGLPFQEELVLKAMSILESLRGKG